jgi:septum formation protein
VTDNSVWLGAPLVLGSKSAARHALLKSAGIDAVPFAPEVDERAIEHEFLKGGGRPADLAQRLAEAKCLAVSQRHPDNICLAADQTLLLNGELFHKAKDRSDLSDALARLAGRTHVLTSAACIAVAGNLKYRTVDSASLTMRPLDAVDIARYLDLAWPDVANSVGGYQIEGLGIHLFSDIAGTQSTIIGLPLLPLLAWLRQSGYLRI